MSALPSCLPLLLLVISRADAWWRHAFVVGERILAPVTLAAVRADQLWSFREAIQEAARVAVELVVAMLLALFWVAFLRLNLRRRTRELREQIARHRRSEEALQTSEEFLRSLIQSLPQNILRKDLEGCFSFASESFCRTVGKKMDEIIGKTDFDLYPHELAAQYRRDDEQVIASGKLFEAIEESRNAAGEKTYVQVIKTPIYDGDHRPLGLQVVFWDVTTRKQAEVALAYERDLLRTLLDNLPDLFYFKDIQSRFVRVSRSKVVESLEAARRRHRANHPEGDTASLPAHLAAPERFGDYIIGKTDFDFFPAAAARMRYDDEQEIIKTGWPMIGKLESLPQFDGTIFWRLTTKMPWRDKSGKVIGTFGISQDITERKQAELRLSVFLGLAQRLSTARSAKEAARIIVDVADQLLGWDACFCDLYSPQQDIQTHVLNVDTIDGVRTEVEPISPKQKTSPLAQRAIREGGFLLLREGSDNSKSEGMPFGDTSQRSASLLFVPIRNGTESIGVLSIQSYKPRAYDQNSLELLHALADHCGGALDRIRGQEALQRVEDRLHHMLAQSPAVLYSRKPTADNLALSWTSQNVTQLLGFSPEEACESDWWTTHLHPADRDRLAAARARLLNEHRASLEYRFQHKDKNYRWLRDEHRLLLDGQGEPVEIVGNLMDITERKQLEELLRQAQKMEAIGQLAGGVAHDFNNLLAVIRGNSELLLLNPGPLSSEGTECLKQVIAASDRAASLTRQLLAFGRKQVMQLQPLNLSDVVANLTKMLKRIIGEDIQLQCSYAPRLPLVHGDVGMMEQVLVNLVVNARDAMPNGGQLLISTEPVRLNEPDAQDRPEARAGDFVRITVTDNGTGIATEHLSRIFEPFFTTKEVGKGTGLGLATVYGIVKQHQGWIEVISKLGKGSTFHIFLPAADLPAAAAAEPVAEVKAPGGCETILLVEDDESVRSWTRRVLENSGYRVREATSGREALDLCRHLFTEIDLLLTDIIMPSGINGRELAETMLAETDSLKVIFMSGYSGDALGREAQSISRVRSRFLQKPCSRKDLLHAVRDSLDEK